MDILMVHCKFKKSVSDPKYQLALRPFQSQFGTRMALPEIISTHSGYSFQSLGAFQKFKLVLVLVSMGVKLAKVTLRYISALDIRPFWLLFGEAGPSLSNLRCALRKFQIANLQICRFLLLFFLFKFHVNREISNRVHGKRQT